MDEEQNVSEPTGASVTCAYCNAAVPANESNCPACGASMTKPDEQPATLVSRPLYTIPQPAPTPSPAAGAEPTVVQPPPPVFERAPAAEVLTAPPAAADKKGPNWILIVAAGCLVMLLLCCLGMMLLGAWLLSPGFSFS